MEPYPIDILSPSLYPPLLREIPDPPKKLFIRGSIPQGDCHYLAVVGSRHASTYGTHAVETLISGLRGYSIVVVSGLALGIDAKAHEAALDANMQTIAVPGSGLSDKVLYPKTNLYLAQRILASGGALLSEYDPDFHATTWSFPARNRIMAGMSHATLIVEARERSGTLITARLALEYNRDVLVVPGSIFTPHSFGPHILMRDGATPIRTSDDILEVLKIKKEGANTSIKTYNTEEEKLMALLETPLHKDVLIRGSRIETKRANELLTLLELKGCVREESGVLYPIKI